MVYTDYLYVDKHSYKTLRGHYVPTDEATQDEELQWDSSAEQFHTYQKPGSEDQITPENAEPTDNSRDTDMFSTLTELDTDTDEVFNTPDPTTRSLRLKRSHAFRRRRRRIRSTLLEPRSHDEDTTTDEESSPKLQPRSKAPHHPKDVQLGPLVQDMSEPLRVIQPTLSPTPPGRLPRPGRSNLDYRHLHNYGERRPRL